MSAPVPSARWRPSDLWRTLAGLTVVLGFAALLLAGLDATPAWILGEPRDVRVVPTVAEAERRLGARLLLPGYFPDAIEWPPSAVHIRRWPVPGAALAFDGRRGGPYMLLGQAARPGDVPDRLLPEIRPLDETPIWIQGEQARLRRFTGPDGQVWRELTWRTKGRQVVLRSRGSVEEMVRMARTSRDEP